MEKNKILVVEDESIVAHDVRNMLLGLGYEVAGGKNATARSWIPASGCSSIRYSTLTDPGKDL